MLAMLQPQVVVADYAPTALLAARACGIPRVTVGTGFALPRLSDPLPALRPWVPVDGAKLRAVRPEVVRETYRMILADTPAYANAHFSALKRILDLEEPDYSR